MQKDDVLKHEEGMEEEEKENVDVASSISSKEDLVKVESEAQRPPLPPPHLITETNQGTKIETAERTQRENDAEETEDLQTNCLDEGGLEEGELEDDEEEAAKEEKNDESENVPLQDATNKTNEKPPEEPEAKEVSAVVIKKEEKKKSHKEIEEDRKTKKKRQLPDAAEEDPSARKKTAHEKSTDYDQLLKREMYLMGATSTPESFNSDDDGYDSLSFPGRRQFRGCPSMEVDSGGSGEEWGDPRRRKRKRRPSRSRSPCRKNEAICMFYLQGSCQRGASCPYSHEITPTRKMELCKFYMMDCCAKREKCLYMHRDFPCKYFHFGMKCKAGDDCKFSHNPLQDVTRNILLKHIEMAPKDILGDFPRLSKQVAVAVLAITEAKRSGDTIDEATIEDAFDAIGKGFKYVDKAAKSMKKKKNAEKKDGGDNGSEEKIKTTNDEKPKKSRKLKEKDEKEKPREKEKERDRDRDRERDRDKDRDRDRSRDKHRDRIRFRGDGSRFSSAKPHFSSHGGSKRRDSQRNNRQLHVSSSGAAGDFKENGPNSGSAVEPERFDEDRAATPQGSWYSSDEDPANPNSNRQSPPSHREQVLDFNDQGTPIKRSKSESASSSKSSEVPNLAGLDVSFLKNLLNKVHGNSSSIPATSASSNREIQAEWNSRTGPDQENEINYDKTDYMDLSKDIKDVFYDTPVQNNRGSRNIVQDLQNLIQDARESSTDKRECKEYPNFYGDRESTRDQFRNSRSESWAGSSLPLTDVRGNADYSSPKGAVDSLIPKTARDPRISRESRWEREDKDAASWQDDAKRDSGSKFSWKKDPDFMTGKSIDTDLRIIPGTRRNSQNVESKDLGIDTDLRVVNSIYDFDLRKLEVKSPEIEGGLPFKVPTHSPAKEIDGSINSRPPMYYTLVEVTVPKPDFSHLKINRDDPKVLDDPRMRKMLRRSSTEEQPGQVAMTQGLPEIKDLSFSSQSDLLKFGMKSQEVESKDPRSLPSRDPRTDPKSSMRVDPRLATRTDPRSINTRGDPRMESRDLLLPSDPDPREPDQPMALGPFSNGLLDTGGYPSFPNMAALQGPLMQHGLDIRGRPGLLGPAPGPNIPGSMAGPGFLMGPGVSPFLPGPGERADLLQRPNIPFQQGQNWNAPRMPFNDPRLNRDLDSFTPPPIS